MKVAPIGIYSLCALLECNSNCNAGLGRCTGPGPGDCCLVFTPDLQCSDDLNCTSYEVNSANELNGYICGE